MDGRPGGGTGGAGRLLLRILLVVGVLEFGVMEILHIVPLDHLWRDLFDALALASISSPVLYLLVVKPVGILATEAEKARSDLARERAIREEHERMEASRAEIEAQLRQSQKMEAIGRLAGGIAHDLNNLLTPMIGCSDLLLAGWDSGDARRDDVEEIREAAERAASLTGQLLAFSRRQPRQPRRLALDEVLRGMERLLARLLGEDIDLVTVLEPDLPAVEIDATHVEQVILNLAVNARDAMPRGGRLTFETRSIDPGTDLPGLPGVAGEAFRVMLVVSDTGHGMDEQTRSHIFEPFFTTKDPGNGTGLGLSTVYGIVRQSGGRIRVESRPGLGTTFRIYLPEAGPPQPQGPAAAEPATADAGGHETVLVVEDEEVVRTLVARVLRQRGYTVLEAPSADQAVALLCSRRNDIDLLLTDVVLPGMGGHQLVELVSHECPQTAALCMSGYGADSVGDKHAGGQGAELLKKPFTPESLSRKVRETLDARVRPN